MLFYVIISYYISVHACTTSLQRLFDRIVWFGMSNIFSQKCMVEHSHHIVIAYVWSAHRNSCTFGDKNILICARPPKKTRKKTKLQITSNNNMVLFDCTKKILAISALYLVSDTTPLVLASSLAREGCEAFSRGGYCFWYLSHQRARMLGLIQAHA